MPVGLPVALLLFAEGGSASVARPAYGPAPAAAAKALAAPVKATDCAPQTPGANSREIVVCAVKPQGYRIDPDVLAARKLKKKGDAGPPRNPHQTYADHSCANVGPMGCRGGPTIDLLGTAMAVATMAGKAAKGENVGKMFVTDPHPSEYQLYQQAKREREEKESDAAAKKVADAARAKAAAAPAAQAPTTGTEAPGK